MTLCGIFFAFSGIMADAGERPHVVHGPYHRLSKAIIRVIILVVLAMLTAVVSLLPESILPESASIRTEYFE